MNFLQKAAFNMLPEDIQTKLLPSQSKIAENEPGGGNTTKNIMDLSRMYREIGILNRSVNIIVDSASELSFDVKDRIGFTPSATVQKEKLSILLNSRPNPFMDINTFKRMLLMDFVMEGHAFIYWDGHGLYLLPASNMEVVMDDKKYINHFLYGGRDKYRPNQIIYIKDNAYYGTSVHASGFSKLGAVTKTIRRLEKLDEFKEKFYDNGAVIGLVIETDTALNKRRKKAYEEEISVDYNPRTGKSNVIVLDAGFKARTISNTGFRELGTAEDQKQLKDEVLTALGIPPVLVSGGNKSTIEPNIKMLYSMTIMPMMRKFVSAFEFFFGYDIKITSEGVMALAPDRKALADYVTSLKNNGVISGNEGRAEIRYPKSDQPDMDTIVAPKNIAGSVTGTSNDTEGRPSNDEDDEDNDE